MRLAPAQLRQTCDPSRFPFATTAELPDSTLVLGQDRAVDAIRFGIGMRRSGYNVFALGPFGAGKHAIVRRYLEEQAVGEPVSYDWCYVNNFDEPHRPRALALPKGAGLKFRDDIAQLVEDLRGAITAALDSEDLRQRSQQIHEEFSTRRDRALEDLRERASRQDVALIRTPVGLGLAPMQHGDVIDVKAFEQLPEAERTRLQASVAAFEDELASILREAPKWHRESHKRIRALKHEATRAAVDALIVDVKAEYEAHAGVQAFLSALEVDVIENADDLRRLKEGDDEQNPIELLMGRAAAARSQLARYQVNVLDGRGPSQGAPVVYEDNPSYHNLVGRIEHVAQMGTLVTDFTHIKAGALHRANGGYLILDARRVLVEPFAWEGLKRALRSRTIRIESLGEALSLVTTVSIEAEAIPLDVKVVLVGDRMLYYLLYEFDPDCRDLFKVAVDFEATTDRSEAGDQAYAAILGTLARRESLRPLSAAGVARVIEHGARVAGDAGKLWIQLGQLTDVLREADYWAGVAHHDAIDATDVDRAIETQVHRASRPRDRVLEAIDHGTILIATAGTAVGQVNGLSVIELGGFAFAQPSRITARARLGPGGVVDIERETKLGGPVHSKGVLILSGYLAGHYVPDQPLSLSASLVFEQSYGGVDGDSASSAELYALLSALSELPVNQALAVTGSINQQGQVQAIGGVNEKVEGFFDVCRSRGLTGEQAVVIPAANLRHLMLRADVVQAVAEGHFHVHAIESVDQGLELLTGVPAGARGADGTFPAGTVHGRVEERLKAFARKARAFRAPGGAAEPTP